MLLLLAGVVVVVVVVDVVVVDVVVDVVDVVVVVMVGREMTGIRGGRERRRGDSTTFAMDCIMALDVDVHISACAYKTGG